MLDTAQRFIFVEYFIMAEGQIWDRLSEILCRKSRQGVEVKLIFDDFGSMMRMPNEKVEELQDAGVEVKVFNPVHHYVNRLYFNYRDHRKITCVDGDVEILPTPAAPISPTSTPTSSSASATGRTAACGWRARAPGV